MDLVDGFFENADEVLAVGAFAHAAGKGLELSGGDVALAVGDFFGAGDFEALAALDGLDEVGGFEEGVVGPGVEPGEAAAEDLGAELAAVQVPGVDVRDLELAAKAG